MKPKRQFKKKEPQQARPLMPADAVGMYCHKKEIARWIGVTPRTLGIWVRQERVPAYRFGRFLRFKWSEVEAALAEGFRPKYGKGKMATAVIDRALQREFQPQKSAKATEILTPGNTSSGLRPAEGRPANSPQRGEGGATGSPTKKANTVMKMSGLTSAATSTNQNNFGPE